MKKDVAEKVAEHSLTPLAEAIRAKLGDTVDVRLYSEPHLTKDAGIEYATWLKCRYNQQRTEVILRILPSDDLYGVWQWGKGGRFVVPIPPGGRDRADSATSPLAIREAAERICETWAEWEQGPPESLNW